MARRSKSRGRNANLPLEFGGMWASGDPRRMPENHVRLLRNMYLRPGRIEKRDPWVRDTGVPSTPTRFFIWSDTSSAVDVLGAAIGGSNVAYRTTSPSWTTVSGGGTVADYTNFSGAAYLVQDYPGHVYKFNGSSMTQVNPATLRGGTVETFIRRIFLGKARLNDENKSLGATTANSVAFGFETGAYWTVSGMAQPTNSSGRRKAVMSVSASTDSLTSATVFTTGAAESYVTYIQSFLSNESSDTVPLRLAISDGTNDLVSQDVRIPPKSAAGDDWYRFAVTARVPASTTVVIKISGVTNTPNSAEFFLADENAADSQFSGAKVINNRFITPMLSATTGFVFSSAKVDRLYWSETDDPTHWLATSYYDCVEEPGPLTVVRSAKDKLWAYKENAVWGFRPTGKDSPTILQESFVRGFGCVGPRAYAQFRGDSIFIGRDEVYAWNHEGDPLELAGPGMREEMFDQSDFLGSSAVCEVDYENKEIYCYTRPGKLYVYNLDAKGWSIFAFSGAADAELNIKDLAFVKANGDSRAAMWAIMDATADIVKLDVSATQENITGTNRDVVAKVRLRPIGSTNPRDRIQIQKIGIDHQIQTTQTGTTTTASVSFDGGNSFPRTNQVTIDDLAAGDGDMQRLHIPVRQSGLYQTIEIKHSGLAGPDAFNIYSGDIEVLLRGSEKDEDTPTQGSATLT